MVKIDIYSKLTGELVDRLTEVCGDTDIELIYVATGLKSKGLFSKDYLYACYFYNESKPTNVFTQETILNRCGEALDEAIERYRELYEK